MHILCWSPALILLVTRRPFFDPAEGRGFRVWSGVMMCAIVFSFVFNFRDAAIYVGHMEG